MESAAKDRTIYEFDGFRLVPGEDLLLRNGEQISLNIKSFGVLKMLVERHGHLVTKSEIIDAVWAEAFVEDGSLTKSIWLIRQALGDTSKERFIQTVPRRGYRFVYPVSVITNGSGAFRLSDLSGIDEPKTEFFPENGTAKTNGDQKDVSATEITLPKNTNGSNGEIVVSEEMPPSTTFVGSDGLTSRRRSTYAVLSACVAGVVVIAAILAIATDTGGGLMARLGASRWAPSKKRGTDNQEAYLAFLQGKMLLDRWTSEDASPIEPFVRAISLDPNYAAAWAGKALAHSYAGFPEHDRNGEHYRQAKEAVDKAISLDPNESLAYTALCHQRLFYEWDYAGAEEAGRRAVELDPRSALARSEYAVLLTARGRAGEAIDHFKKALEADSNSFAIQFQYANALYAAQRYNEAETQYKGLIDLKPERKATYWWLVEVMEAQDKEAEAVEWTVKLMAIENKGDEAIQRYKAAYESGGYRAALLERINAGLMKGHAYFLLGDRDKQFEGLEDQYRRHFYHLAVFGIVDPKYDALHSDPRWIDLVRRVRGE